MLIKDLAGQVVAAAPAGGGVSGYDVVKADGTVIPGGGVITGYRTSTYFAIALLAGEVDTLGPLTIVLLDGANHGIGAINESVGEVLPGEITATALTNIAVAVLDLVNAIETGVTVRQALRACAAVLAGQGGPGGGHTIYHAIGNPGTSRVDATTPGGGNRSAVNLTL